MPRVFTPIDCNALTCLPGMNPCIVALTTSAPMSTRWMNSRGTMLLRRAGGTTRATPLGEKVPGAYEEPAPRSPADDGGGGDPSPRPPPTLIG